MLIFDSNMSDAYYDKEKSKPGYILMNLLLPFIICGLISFLVKILIMPSYTIDKMIKKIQNNEHLSQFFINNENESIEPTKINVERKQNEKKESDTIKIELKKRKRDIKNVKQKNITIQNNTYKRDFHDEKALLEKEFGLIYSFYIKKVIIYFLVGFFILSLNWYMMTSFCAIFRNTGLKLLVNSIISLFASFVLPFILGLIPAGLGYLSIKTKKELIYRIYKVINIIL